MTKKNILSIIILGLIVGSTFATGTLPTITNVNVNNGDVLVKDIINNLQGNIKKIWDYLNNGFEVNGTVNLKDVYGRGGRNLVIGDDTYLSDVDIANMLGLYGLQNNDRAGLRFGSDGGYIWSDNAKFGINTQSLDSTLNVNGDIKIMNGSSDKNDGKIAHNKFAKGLNIVGINDGNGREISFWGNLVQKQGMNYFNASEFNNSARAKYYGTNHYGRFGIYNNNGRGYYMGWGNGGDYAEMKLERVKYFTFQGGNEYRFMTKMVQYYHPLEVKNSKTVLYSRYDSDRLLLGFRHLGTDNNPIEIRTEDVNDDGIILVSNGHDVANFKKNGVTIDSKDISLKATGTNKGLRIKSDGSVCMGACW